jgi:heterodisulfide reductase subunit A-like polyferredoxin
MNTKRTALSSSLSALNFFWRFSLTKKGALVIGGGVAGIQAALDLADSNFQVYLVERSSTLGGRMAQIDKTFPTMDCAI